jgi:ribose 5-phosphate isomerase B
MRIAVASDHAGFEGPEPLYKPAIIAHLRALGHEVADCGPGTPDPVDYPDMAERVCRTLLCGEADLGILLCGTGIGMSIAANRYPGIRAAACTTEDMARLSREHNNANILCLGRRTLSLEQCLALADLWLATPFSEGERHRRRVDKLG